MLLALKCERTFEMRIFALILLGITSSAKMKNASLDDRDSFEQRVQQIGG